MKHTMHGKSAGDVFSDARLAELAQASCEGDRARVAAAVEGGADPNGKGFQGTTPLVWAVDCQNEAGVEALLRAGADPNYVWADHVTPTFMAATRKNTNVLRIILEHGGNPNTVSSDGDNVLLGALSLGLADGYWDNYYLLLRSGADITSGPDGMTIVDNAAMFYQYDKVAELLDMDYHGDLLNVGRLLQAGTAIVDPDSKQGKWEKRVRAMLEQRGVRFPIPAPVFEDEPDDNSDDTIPN